MLDLGQNVINKKKVVELDTLSVDALAYLLTSITGVTHKGDLEAGEKEMKGIRVRENAKEIDDMYSLKKKGQGKQSMIIGALSKAKTVVLKPGQAMGPQGEEYKVHLGVYVETQREVESANALFAVDQVMTTQMLAKDVTPRTILVDIKGTFYPARKMLPDSSEVVKKWHAKCGGSFEPIAQRKALYELFMENPVVHHFQLPTMLSAESDFSRTVVQRKQLTSYEDKLIGKYKLKKNMTKHKFGLNVVEEFTPEEVEESVLYASIAKHRNVRGVDTNKLAPVCRLAYTGEIPVQFSRTLIEAWRIIAIAKKYGGGMIKKNGRSEQIWGFVGQHCMVHDDTLVPKDTYETYLKKFKGDKDEAIAQEIYDLGVANYANYPNFSPLILIQSAAPRPDMTNAGFKRGKDRDIFINQIQKHIKVNKKVIYSVFALQEDFEREWSVLPDPVSHNGQVLIMGGQRTSYTYKDFCYRVLRQNQLITLYPLTRQVVWHKYDNVYQYETIVLPLRTKQTDEEVLEIDDQARKLVKSLFKTVECVEEPFDLVMGAVVNHDDDDDEDDKEDDNENSDNDDEGEEEEEVPVVKKKSEIKGNTKKKKPVVVSDDDDDDDDSASGWIPAPAVIKKKSEPKKKKKVVVRDVDLLEDDFFEQAELDF
jgi:hypothetical protein